VAYAKEHQGKHIITTAIEHHAVIRPCKFLEKRGFSVTYLAVDRDGLVDPQDVKKAITDETILISVMHANNEIGTIEPIKEIAGIAKDREICFHTDAVQTVGHLPVDVDALKVDLASISAHKLYGPKGVGALYIRKGTKIVPFMHGGEQEQGRRASTQNVPGIVGFGKACELAQQEMGQEKVRLETLRDKLISGILDRIDNERNIIKPLLNVVYLRKQFDIVYYSSNHILKVTRGSNTNYFYVFGGKDEASYQTVQGITAGGAFLDEVVLMPQSFVNQVLARCSVEDSKYWFSSNPDGPEHWFYIEWILKLQNKNAKYLHFVMDDNPSLSDKIKARYRRMYTGVFFQRYILGLWVRAEGLIYGIYASNEESFLLDEVPKDIMFINAGVDFGGTESAHTFVATGFTSKMKSVVILEAERHEEEVSPAELDMLFVEFCIMVYDKYGKPFNARCDNAEPVLIRGL